MSFSFDRRFISLAVLSVLASSITTIAEIKFGNVLTTVLSFFFVVTWHDNSYFVFVKNSVSSLLRASGLGFSTCIFLSVLSDFGLMAK